MPQIFPWPQELNKALADIAAARGQVFHAVGGTVRDVLLARPVKDLDLVVQKDAIGCGHALAAVLPGSSVVVLSSGRDQVRVVWGEITVDLASYRDGATRLEEDLLLRDFTVNAMAVPVLAGDAGIDAVLVDPAGGRRDLERGVLVALGQGAFTADPLRLLRAYRLAASLGFSIDPALSVMLTGLAPLIARPAAERIAKELDLILASSRAAATVRLMTEHGAFFVLFPEMTAARGMAQPDSHHLDVLSHCFAALEEMERIIAHPAVFFQGDSELCAYLVEEHNRLPLKWAALFHDMGKPVARKIIAGRITFHQHERMGAELFAKAALRLKWGGRVAERTSRLIALHMRPLHLANAFLGGAPSRRASYRIYKAAAGDLPGLFCLALADCLAAAGPGKPAGIEATLLNTWRTVASHVQEFRRTAAAGPRLLTGHDLTTIFALAPGPIFSVLLAKIEELRACGEIASKEAALSWVKNTLNRQSKEQTE